MKQQQIFVEYLDHMGTDLTVVNAARASFGKQKTEFTDADANLIRYLATGYRSAEWEAFLDEVVATPRDQLGGVLRAYKRKAQHWAPFAHPQVQIRMSLPIFLARQFVKHQVGAVWSEESRRYISDEPGVWFPSEWHSRPDDVKQGSGGLVGDQAYCSSLARTHARAAVNVYRSLMDEEGVAPEEARIVLPLNMMTTVVWTGSLLFWSRVCNQRVDSHAQLAAQELGRLIAGIVEPLFPVSWKELTA
jgi:thymidylate synthase (FAD)